MLPDWDDLGRGIETFPVKAFEVDDMNLVDEVHVDAAKVYEEAARAYEEVASIEVRPW